MNINEAYQKVMDVIKEIEDNGIKIEIRVPKAVSNKELVEKYNQEDRLSVDLWRRVEFQPETPPQVAFIYEKSKELSKDGILFDTGHGCGGIDWEIDWSLYIAKNEEDIDSSIQGKKIVQDMAENCLTNSESIN